MTTRAPNILEAIKNAGLVGRGGAGFLAHLKWTRMKEVKSDVKYVVCNASEGEPDVKKDFYILDNHMDKVIKGMVVALDFLGQKEAYINMNGHYYQKLETKLTAEIEKYKSEGYVFHVYVEEPSYIGGESSALLNAIEGKRVQPRPKHPSPSIVGIFGKPALVHNVETFYNVALVSENTFSHKRFYTVGGAAQNPGVYELSDDLTIEKVLKETNNYPSFPFFVQVGGGASGKMMNEKQLDKGTVSGCASIHIYPITTTTRALLLQWFKFYMDESCGKCTPCREGTYQLYEMVKKSETIPWKKILEIVDTMKKTAFCALGSSLSIPIETYIENILQVDKSSLIN